MKRIIILLSFAFYLLPAFGQSPNGMTYQAVIRNSSDQLVSNTTIGIQISILQGSVSGTVVYSEIQTPMTNANGLISIEVGNGNGFDTINWANGPYFIKAEVDLAGGTNYAITGTSQLLSVPYALHAKTAESITGGINETDPVYSSSPASGITTPDIQNWNTAYNWGNHANAGYLTQESQILNISNDTIYLTGGSFVKLPAGFNGQYSSLTGAPTNVSAFTNDAGYLTSEIDGSVTNELQTLSISNDTVYLTNGGFIKLPVGFDGQYSSLTGTPTNVSAFTNDAGYLTHESQILNIFNDTIYLTGGSFVKLPAGFDGQYSSLTGVPTNVSAFTNDAGYINSEVDPKIGTMTDGYSPKWNGTNLVTGAIYQDANGHVGIGTTSPGSAMLSVWNGDVSVSNGGVRSNTGFWGDALRTNWGNDLLLRSSYAGKGIIFETQSGEKMRIDANGNLGIGTTTPGAKLEVNGQVKITGGTPGLNKVLTSDATGLATWSTLTPSGLGAWSLTGNAGTVDGTNFIGTTDNVPLNFRVNNVLSGKIDPILDNTFFGYEAGYSNSIGKWNVGIGKASLYNMNSGTGNANVAIGHSTLYANISGGGNVAIGHSAMSGNTSGAINTAIGYGALTGNLSGNNNTALGAYSGQNATGTGNVFLGYQAGYNETGSNKLYIANSSVNPPLIYGDFSTGSIGIATTTLTSGYTTNNKLMVNGGATFTPNTGSDRVTVAPMANLSSGYASFLVISPSSLAMTGGEALSKVHIQNASSTIPALWIVNQGTGDLLSLGNTNSIGSASVVVKNSGNVGIGTTSPTGMLHVENTGTTLFKVGDDVTLAGMTNGGTGAAGSVNITGGSDITGTGTSGGSVTIMAGAWGATDRAKIVLNAVGTGGTGGGLTISGGFSTAGSINIGRRTVNGGPAGAVVIAGGDGGSNGNGGTVTLAGGTGTGDVSYRGGDVVIKGGDGQSPSPAGNILFKIGNVEKARFSNAGKFGIGTTTPTADLEVNGDVKVSGSIYAPGTVVQTVVQTSDVTSSLNTTTLTEADPSYRISITPKYANSIILIEYSFSINTAFDHNTIFRMQLIRDIGGTEVPVGIGPVNGLRNQSTFTGRTQGFDTNDNQTIYMVAKDQGLSVGTTYTYGFKYQREGGGGGTCYFNYSMGDSDIYGFSGIMTMKITEIAQ